jgi:hypothetical protein
VAGLELVVGGAVGAGVIYVWIWRRFQNIRAFFRSRKRVEELERAFRAAREDMTVPNPYREATRGDDARTFSQLLRTKIVLPMLHTVGFVHVTDLIVVGSTFDRSTAIRALIDRDREIVALVFATESGVMLEFSSFTEDEVYSTRLGKVVSVADPPSIHRQTFPLRLRPIS